MPKERDPLDFHLPPWELFLKKALEEDSRWLFLGALVLALMSSQAGKETDNQLLLRMEGTEGGTSIHYKVPYTKSCVSGFYFPYLSHP